MRHVKFDVPPFRMHPVLRKRSTCRPSRGLPPGSLRSLSRNPSSGDPPRRGHSRDSRRRPPRMATPTGDRRARSRTLRIGLDPYLVRIRKAEGRRIGFSASISAAAAQGSVWRRTPITPAAPRIWKPSSTFWSIGSRAARWQSPGFSLGANITLKYLGEQATDLPSQVAGGVAINPPIDLSRCVKSLIGPLQKRYDRYFVGASSSIKSLQVRMGCPRSSC